MDAIYTGKVISDRRKELNLTQKELAEMLNVTDKAISRWENGLNYPDIGIMDHLANSLGISVIELLGLEEEDSEQIVKQIADISVKEKDKIIDTIIKQGWVTAVIGLLLAIALIYLEIVLRENLIVGLPLSASGGMLGFVGAIIGYGLYAATKGKRLKSK